LRDGQLVCYFNGFLYFWNIAPASREAFELLMMMDRFELLQLTLLFRMNLIDRCLWVLIRKHPRAIELKRMLPADLFDDALVILNQHLNCGFEIERRLPS